MVVALLFVGLVGLWLGTELTIRGAVTIAKRLGMSEFIVGVAVVSVGSDLPELTIAISGAVQNIRTGEPTSDIIVGSALGSALGQIGLVMGIAGLLGYLTLPRQIVYRHGSILIGSLLILVLCGLDGLVTRTEGASLVTVYVIYLVYLLTERTRSKEQDEDGPPRYALRAWLFLVVGLVTVVGSAELTVRTVIDVAEAMNIEQSVIAVIVIGVGTSLPELSISIAAVLKKRSGLSVGNLIGSNIFDTLMPIGVAGTLSTLRFDPQLLRGDLPFLIGLSCLVVVFFVRKRGLQKQEATILLALYCSYAAIRIGNA